MGGVVYRYGMSRRKCDLGPKQERAAAEPPSNCPSFGYSRLEIISYRDI